MNHACAIARRRAEQVRSASSQCDKRRHILFCLDALRALETINDGKGFASPAGVPPHAPAPPSPFKCAGKCEVKKNEQ